MLYLRVVVAPRIMAIIRAAVFFRIYNCVSGASNMTTLGEICVCSVAARTLHLDELAAVIHVPRCSASRRTASCPLSNSLRMGGAGWFPGQRKCWFVPGVSLVQWRVQVRY